ncbi:MAG TPA: L-threonylcarbamoyladenylate synthase [Gaiellaceae bacterium]|nr:L-threonylcarbamoyladenylate synthase [Gaiellaceae bacterium]
MNGDEVRAVADALRSGKLAILPTDTVYGLCCSPYRPEPSEHMYRLKGRGPQQPTTLLAADVEALFELVPELRGRSGMIARALLPGPYTLVLPNPARRYRWLAGSTPEAIGVRVPELPDESAAVVARVGGVAATSANLRGGPDPRRLEDVPDELRSQAVAVDGGELPGRPSTVLDFTGAEPRIVREGAAPGHDALERAVAALA